MVIIEILREYVAFVYIIFHIKMKCLYRWTIAKNKKNRQSMPNNTGRTSSTFLEEAKKWRFVNQKMISCGVAEKILVNGSEQR